VCLDCSHKSVAERGAALHEVATAAGLLLIVFILAANYLLSAGQARRNASLNTVDTVLPCDGDLSSVPGACE